MANLQSGFGKHYNWVNKRAGALFYRGFQKEALVSYEDLKTEEERQNRIVQKNPHNGN